jgi:gliding motility-associated-like protein
MKKVLFIFLSLILSVHSLYATHNRAGEITFKRIAGLQYQVSVITYTKESAPADRPAWPIDWGDGTSDTLLRSNGGGNGEIIGIDIKKNVYVGIHTYPGTSTYILKWEDPNRNGGVVNIPGSVNIPFYIESKLVISSALGYNNSVVLLQPPIDDGCLGQVFIHNPNAYDPDGDSLSYELIECKGAGGLPIPGYVYPTASNSFTLNPTTGDLVWDSPTMLGEFNVAFLIEEWRNGFMIGYVERDMQITIQACNNHPPQINNIADICVEAGSQVNFSVSASDPEGELITLSATGGPFTFNPDSAEFPPVTGTSPVSQTFIWNTTCNHVRRLPYQVVFKAMDNNMVPLVDIQTVNITVVAPSPKNPVATPLGSSIILNWNQEVCSKDSGYYIYRRNGFYGFIPGLCQTGVPAYTGYTKIATVKGIANTTYTDNNNGAGLVPGVDYCYMIVGYFPDGALSYASVEVCAYLKKDIPVITNVSVTNTDAVNGTMYVAWSKPTELDTNQFPGPYEYRLYRSTGFAGNNLVLISSFNDLNDTIYNDNGLNTVSGPYSYVVELHNAANGFIGKTQVASSVFLSISPTDHALNLSWQENVPWNNDTFVVYRQNGTAWDSIGVTSSQEYVDTGLINGTQYCYYVMSIGSYSSPGFVDPIINLSQRTCSIPYDNVAPCVTTLDTANFDCGSAQIAFQWMKPDNACASDLDHYNIYYSAGDSASFHLLATVTDPNQTTYTFVNIESIAGCFYLTAVDTNNNESGHLNEICVDNCPFYELPNVFTPDGNNKNDLLIPFPYRFVKDIDLHIYNRWGQEVFSTTDRDINWNGTVNNTGKALPAGVYFYHCTLNEIYRSGIKQRSLKPGFIQLLRSANSINK